MPEVHFLPARVFGRPLPYGHNAVNCGGIRTRVATLLSASEWDSNPPPASMLPDPAGLVNPPSTVQYGAYCRKG